MEVDQKKYFRKLEYFCGYFLAQSICVNLLSVVTPSTLWFCTSSMMLSFAVKKGGGEIRYYILPFLSCGY